MRIIGKKNSPPEILPGFGLDAIYFGMSEKEVSSRFGIPDERREFDDGDVHYDYDSEGISFFFRADEDGVLAGMEVDLRCKCTIWGVVPWELDRAKLLGLLSSDDPALASDSEPLTCIGGDGEESVRVDDLSLEFYLGDSGLVESINWSVVVSSADKILWPPGMEKLAEPPELGERA